MEVKVTCRHVEPNKALKKHAEEKVSRVRKYIDRQVNADVILSMEKNRYLAEVNVTGDGITFNGKEESNENFFVAIDQVVDKIISQASRFKTKQKKRKNSSELTIRHNIISLAEGSTETRQPKIIHTENYFVKPMPVEEAIMQLDLIDNDFLVFTNAQSKRVNVLFKRRDGNYGLIEAEGF
jgi:putative sigma-54 modulation protein